MLKYEVNMNLNIPYHQYHFYWTDMCKHTRNLTLVSLCSQCTYRNINLLCTDKYIQKYVDLYI